MWTTPLVPRCFHLPILRQGRTYRSIPQNVQLGPNQPFPLLCRLASFLCPPQLPIRLLELPRQLLDARARLSGGGVVSRVQLFQLELFRSERLGSGFVQVREGCQAVLERSELGRRGGRGSGGVGEGACKRATAVSLANKRCTPRLLAVYYRQAPK